MPSTSIKPIIDAAFSDYVKQTGIDPAKHPFADQLQTCHSPDDVLKLLEVKANEFKDYREGNRKLIDRLKPVVNVIHVFSDVLGEVVSLVSRNRYILPVHIDIVRLLGVIPTSEGDLCWCGCSPCSMYHPHSPTTGSHYIRMLQTASGVSSSYDALVDLFECVGGFLKRLRIYTDFPLTPLMLEISVKIMVELLSVLALATKQIKQGRFSKWTFIFDIQ
jgi:hypothetical protein